MIILIGLGGALGAVTRLILGKWITANVHTSFPFGTWIINLTGSFLLGLLFSLHSSHSISDPIWSMFAIGFLGSYTTFSTFSFEALTLFIKGEKKQCIFYILSSVFIGILFAWLGIMLSKNLL